MRYAIRYHPAIGDDLLRIAQLVADYAGPEVAAARIAEIIAATERLAETPHTGSLREEIANGLRAIPVGRKGVLVFTVDDGAREVLVHIIGYAGSDWGSSVRGRVAPEG